MKIWILCLTPYVGLAQQFPTIDSLTLTQSIDKYYATNAAIQIAEYRETRKLRWLAYLPNPGYSPFTGGFTVSFNLSTPLQEVRSRNDIANKVKKISQESIQQANELKNSINADRFDIELDIATYQAKFILDSIRLKTHQLTTALYERNEITPSQYLASCQIHEAWIVQRFEEQQAIIRRINQLRVRAKMPIVTNNGH